MKPKNEKKYKAPKPTKRQRIMNAAYLVSILAAFEAIGLAMLIFPRSTYSESERRELEKFPELTVKSYFEGELTSGISKWFSDTVPYRDNLTEMSVALRELSGVRQDGIRLHNVNVGSKPDDTPSAPPVTAPKPSGTTAPSTSGNTPAAPDSADSSESSRPADTSAPDGNHEIDPIQQQIYNDEAINITNNGIAVVGTRALMLYGGNLSVSESYAGVINKFKEALGADVNVYSMVIPTSCEFYSPPAVRELCGSQLENINRVIDNLREDVKAVDAYTPLAEHTDEEIFLRTDHHWAHLGAYYAAKEFAKVADVPFADISEYERRVVHDYVGTMYAYSEDIVLKNNPEEFFYYVPTNVDYTATYTNYNLNEDGVIVSAEQPFEADFFLKYPDGSSMAYCTFMGGDAKIVRINSDAGTGRKLIIFKDSFGNALPSWLFGSFDEIHVVDYRYFTHNAIEYIKSNGITDVLFANNAFGAATASTVTRYETFITQNDWGF